MRSFITHTTSNYENITLNLVKSIKKYSKYDIIVYTIDYDGTDKLQKEAKCIRVDLNLPSLEDNSFINNINGNFYVDREKIRSYHVLGAKVDVMLLASQFIDEWVYLDSDSIANKNVDDLFEYCSKATEFPLATLGPQEYVLLVKEGKVIGNPFWKNDGSIDNENTLEYPLMSFMGVPKNQRSWYRTTNILVGNNTISDFISFWKDVKNLLPRICQLSKITPFHEETIYNVLTWKINPNHNGLPMSYINVESSSTVKHFLSTDIKENTLISEFYRVPKNKKEIKVFHGEKRQDEIDKMFQIIDDHVKNNPLRILFLAPHLSTGGMPAYLLKRIESILQYTSGVEIFVAEFCEYSTLYTVQRNKIKELIPENRFWTINTLDDHNVENSMRVIDIIKNNSIDIVHIDEMIERFDSFNKVSNRLKNALYNNDRTWRVVETCHNIWFEPDKMKEFHPDAYALCTPYHLHVSFKDTPSHKEVFEFPIENKFRSREEQVKSQEMLSFILSEIKLQTLKVIGVL